MGECKQQYIVTVYSLTGAPAQAWRAPVPQPTSLACDQGGTRLIVGTEEGEVHVFAAAAASDPHIEKFHRGPVVHVVPAPGDHWVFTEDAAAQQRIWKLP
jgi:hypothetical protein